MSSAFPAFYLCGPTACGKSGVAVALAQRIGGEIVNADAFQLYEGLDICTAKPTAAERAVVPHHLYGVLPTDEACDAQRFRDLALPVIADVIRRNRWPIIVGGSGLYIKSLTHGLAPLPKADAALRAELALLSPQQRVDELLRLDPGAAANVPLQNDRYVSRALEICRLTGQPQSALRSQWQQNAPSFNGALLTRERSDLYARIDARVLAMVDQGLVDEIRNLPPGQDGAHKAIGVRDIQSHLRGECTLAEAVAAIQMASRRYAKRQNTWFRREHGFQTICLAPDSTAQFAAEQLITHFPCLLQPPPSAPSS